MVKIYDKGTGEFLGRVSQEELAFLKEQLEEEGLADRDYFLRKETIDGFLAEGAPPRLIEVLKGGLRNLPSIEIRWEEDK